MLSILFFSKGSGGSYEHRSNLPKFTERESSGKSKSSVYLTSKSSFSHLNHSSVSSHQNSRELPFTLKKLNRII